MKIVVQQMHRHNLESIKEKIAHINKSLSEKIFFTLYIDDVLNVVRMGGPVLVIAGQGFGLTEYGIDFPKACKELNPETVFFLYSLYPMPTAYVDGVVQKEMTHTKIVELLSSDFTDKSTISKLKKQFSIPT